MLSWRDHVSKSIKDQNVTEEEWETVFGSKDSGTVIVVSRVMAMAAQKDQR